MTEAAAKYRIPLGILFAIALTETGINANLHAYALNLEGNTVYSLGKSEAIQKFNAARASGMKLIDVGCMQLNWYYHGENFSSVAEMLDPHKNVDYGPASSPLEAAGGKLDYGGSALQCGQRQCPGPKALCLPSAVPAPRLVPARSETLALADHK